MLDNARIGDRIVFNMDRETRGWHGRGVPDDGAVGTIVGKTRFIRHESRTGVGRAFREPGIYEQDGTSILRFDGADEDVQGWNNYINFADPITEQQRRDEWINHEIKCTIARGDYFRNSVRIGDLPDTPFWEGDRVTVAGERREYFIVQGISYGGWGPQKADCYNLSAYDLVTGQSAYSTSRGLESLTLESRGNVWREAHGEPLVFSSIAEETGYAESVGRTTEVRNPASGIYSWTKDEALDAIEAGIADGFTMPMVPFANHRTISMRRFHDRDLGERVRAETLKGFDRVAV
jgi:hypothetical protein